MKFIVYSCFGMTAEMKSVTLHTIHMGVGGLPLRCLGIGSLAHGCGRATTEMCRYRFPGSCPELSMNINVQY